ncbi:MAG: hypothetical protein IV103_08045 [Zoogloea sp.]|nr:hypothetical protein [Zoogloea sp.]
MIMPLWRKLSVGIFALLAGVSFPTHAAYENTPAWWQRYGEERDAIYAHMKRYGITREGAAAMRRLTETAPPYFQPHVNIRTEGLLRPGEHYRIEMDEFILTMKVPGLPASSSWIWPYTNTRTPDPAMEKLLQRENGMVQVANLGWYTCRSIFPPGLFGRCETAGVGMLYRVLKPEERDDFSTPEKLRELSRMIMRNAIRPREEIEKAILAGNILNGADNRIHLDSETVVINGRVWVRDAMDSSYSRRYVYKTALSPDRMVGFTFGLPEYDYSANPDPSSYPAAIKRAFVLMEEVVASVRIARVNDDGSPDPFVIERVKPAPLPVREKRPTAQ